jgi:hypothetical protein
MAKKIFKMTPLHDKFCQHYAEYGNATQAYLFAFPNVKYGTAKTEGNELLTKPDIKEKIDQLKEEFAVEYRQTKEGTIRDLIQTAEEAKAQGQFSAYAKLRDMIIKMCGFYEPEKIEHSGAIDIKLSIPGVDDATEEEDEQES